MIFRTRAVVVSGALDLVVGIGLMAWGAALTAGGHGARPAFGAALVLLGAVVGATGAGRMAARLEVHDSKLVWTWPFSRHELSFDNVVQAALVEPGSPASGGEWGTLLSGGVVAVAGWWLAGLALSMFRAGPTLGSSTLEILRRRGGPVRISPIGTFCFEPTRSTAFAAQQAVDYALGLYRARVARHDA